VGELTQAPVTARELTQILELEQLGDLGIYADLLREATTTVERELNLEDQGWIRLGSITGDILTPQERTEIILQSRRYAEKDPLGKQAIRLWTDYTFGTGMTWQTKEEPTRMKLKTFWDDPLNRGLLSSKGQRKSCAKLLVDGEIFFQIWLKPGGRVTLRRINPLEIKEIITDPDDAEVVLFYKREWTDTQNQQRTAYYRDWTNPRGEPAKSSIGLVIRQTADPLVYHLAINDACSPRGNPLLLPAMDWIKQYRRFLASRVAIVLALARFAWAIDVKGTQAQVDTVKAALDDETPDAGSMAVQNENVKVRPIKVDSGARNAYEDGRMLKLQVCAAVGIPEQYFGDISIGNLATAKTVELPMLKMFQSYQQVWCDTYEDIDNIVLAHNNVPSTKWHVDRDFPAITPEDMAGLATSIEQILRAMPDLASVRDVQQAALMSIGINDTEEVLKQLDDLAKESGGDVNLKLAKVLREFQKAIKESGT